MPSAQFSDLIGKILSSVTVNEKNDQIRFECKDGEVYLMFHDQDCCEHVVIDDISGNLKDLIGAKILSASEDVSIGVPESDDKYSEYSNTWTFYNIATRKGHVQIKWWGSSNGYYSESVDFKRMTI